MDCLTNITATCGGGSANGLPNQLMLQLLQTLILSQCKLKPEYPPDRSHSLLPSYDFIVIGAGSSGSPLAANLANNTKWNVLLIEAGNDPDFNSDIPYFFGSIQRTEQDWSYLTEPQTRACRGMINKQCAWPRGKLLGGCSSINAMIYNMGNPADYNEWQRLGNDGWDWNSVKQYFEQHLNSQLAPNRDDSLTDSNHVVAKVREMILDAGREMGFPIRTDPYEISQSMVGYYKVLLTIKNGVRNSAARAYLVPKKDSVNLHVAKNSLATRIRIDANRVSGVEVLIDGELVRIGVTKEVIVSAGAINTPQLLMLSGIGPKNLLSSLDIPVVSDLPVGSNLQDHALVVMMLALTKLDDAKPETVLDMTYQYLMHRQGVFGSTTTANIVTYFNPNNQSQVGALGYHYLLVQKNDTQFIESLVSGFNYDRHIAAKLYEAVAKSPLLFVYMNLLQPKSRGTIKLKSTDPRQPPVIEPNYFSNANDMATLLQGFRHIQMLANTTVMKKVGTKIVDFDLDECQRYDYDTDDYWICTMEYFACTLYHPCCTASMTNAQQTGVLDAELKVHGVYGLRVADASVMPQIVSGNTNAACIMIGEKLSDLIRTEWAQNGHNEL